MLANLLTLFIALSAHAEICATHFSELDQTDRLKVLKQHFINMDSAGFVNETEGSYFEITSREDVFIMTFYTTGLFDLFGIRREGPIRFCDDDNVIKAIGLDRTEILTATTEYIKFGDGEKRQTFHAGSMPESMRPHFIKAERDIASEDPKK